MNDEDAERQVRAARNESLFRLVNERLEALAETFQFIAERTTFTCECPDQTCVATMLMTIDEYEALRSHPNRFAVLPGHVDPSVEDVMAEGDRFVVVEKIGAGAAIAEKSDPRTE